MPLPTFKYPSDIGPGVYDIHSPRVPSQAEMERLVEKALDVLSPQQLWINPDCGLKTRGWAEVKPPWCRWWRRRKPSAAGWKRPIPVRNWSDRKGPASAGPTGFRRQAL